MFSAMSQVLWLWRSPWKVSPGAHGFGVDFGVGAVAVAVDGGSENAAVDLFHPGHDNLPPL
jgi:hypothetical protein